MFEALEERRRCDLKKKETTIVLIKGRRRKKKSERQSADFKIADRSIRTRIRRRPDHITAKKNPPSLTFWSPYWVQSGQRRTNWQVVDYLTSCPDQLTHSVCRFLLTFDPRARPEPEEASSLSLHLFAESSVAAGCAAVSCDARRSKLGRQSAQTYACASVRRRVPLRRRSLSIIRQETVQHGRLK